MAAIGPKSVTWDRGKFSIGQNNTGSPRTEALAHRVCDFHAGPPGCRTGLLAEVNIHFLVTRSGFVYLVHLYDFWIVGGVIDESISIVSGKDSLGGVIASITCACCGTADV